MIKVCFVCYGNICRSPMAEFLFKRFVEEKGKAHCFEIESRATSFEEIGNGIHRGTRAILDKFNIDYSSKRSQHFEKVDYDYFDYIIVMDEMNERDTKRISRNGDKIYRLLEFAGIARDVADPWWTRNFDATYDDVMLGINAFYNYLTEKGLV